MNRLRPELASDIAPYTTKVDNFALAGGSVAKRYAIPTGAKYVGFSCTKAGLWIKFGNNAVAAVVCTGDVTDGSGSVLDPTIRAIDGGVTHVSLNNAGACEGSLEWYV